LLFVFTLPKTCCLQKGLSLEAVLNVLGGIGCLGAVLTVSERGGLFHCFESVVAHDAVWLIGRAVAVLQCGVLLEMVIYAMFLLDSTGSQVLLIQL
jgi:hypothetical protein